VSIYDKFHKGDRVRINGDATYATKRLADKRGVKTLTATVLNEHDPCCGCHVVEFDLKLGNTDVFYTDGKLGYCDEVKPRDMKKSSAKRTAEKAIEADEFVKGMPRLGTRVKVIKEYDAAKVGMVGTIARKPYSRTSLSWGVRFDKLTHALGGHSLTGALVGDESGMGQWVPLTNLALLGKENKADAPKAKPYVDTLEPGTVKVHYATTKPLPLTSGRTVPTSGSFYGWLTTVIDGSVRRQYIMAPFGTEWMLVDIKNADGIENIRPAA